MTLTKLELAENLVEKLHLNRLDAKSIVDNFFEEIRTALGEGAEVKLSGFGNFTLRDKASRPGRNPKTNESAPVSARRVVSFKPGQKLRHRVENAQIKS